MYKADYKQIAATPSFQAFLKQKRAFIVPSAIFFCLLFFTSCFDVLFHLFECAGHWSCFMGLAVCHRPIRHDLDPEYGVFPKGGSFRSLCKRFKGRSEG